MRSKIKNTRTYIGPQARTYIGLDRKLRFFVSYKKVHKKVQLSTAKFSKS